MYKKNRYIYDVILVIFFFRIFSHIYGQFYRLDTFYYFVAYSLLWSLVVFILISIAYMLVSYFLFSTNGYKRIKKKEGILISFASCFVGFLLMFTVKAIEVIEGTGFFIGYISIIEVIVISFLYFIVNVNLFVDYKNKLYYSSLPKDNICINCNNQLKENAHFCSKCGARYVPDGFIIKINDQGFEYIKCDNCGCLVKDFETSCPNCNLDFKDIDSSEEVENTFICEICGAIVKEDASECPKCGLRFETDDDEENNDNEDIFICDNCGAFAKANEKVCPNCGEEFEEDVSAYSDSNTFICTNCGSFVKEYEERCPNCGAKFEEEDDEDDSDYEHEEFEDKYNDLTKLKKLLDKNIITKAEFEKEKKKILR